MTQSLFTSMTGLNAGTQQLTVVSDNVANMNTTAYKTSRVNFQDIWYQTKTTGTNSTKNSGGTNPFQIGVGVKGSSITKDFGPSSTNTTGKSTDMAIQGQGWFTVLTNDNEALLTRDGTFSLDEDGFLCTTNGFKVLGMDTDVSRQCSTTPIKIPQTLKVDEYPTPVDKLKMFGLDELNNSETITDGKFIVKGITTNAAGEPVITEQVVELKGTKDINMEGLVAQLNAQGGGIFTAELVDGAIQFKPAGDNKELKFESINDGTGSNFVNETNIASLPRNDDGSYSTKDLNISADISVVDDIKDESTRFYKEFSVGKDGLITVTYDDGSTLTVRANQDGTTYFSYENRNAVRINDDIENSNRDSALAKNSLYVDPNVLVKANLQMQFAKVTNDEGLVAVGGNLYDVGVNAGEVLYSASNVNGIGGLQTGALESSNVDLAQQFANMILAQRLVQANSQVFSGANQLLETLVYLGRG